MGQLSIPNNGGQDGRSLTTTTSTPMKLKNEFSFGPSQVSPLLLLTKLKSSTLNEKVIQLIVFTNYVITHTDFIKDLRVLFGTTFIFSVT